LAARNKKLNASVSPDAPAPQTNPQPDLKPDGHCAQFPVVGIGASAGGLDAFKRFFAAMPPDSGMAFILIPHLDPTHRSLMVELLGRQTKMQVCEAGTGMPIEPNRVYIIPPNKSLSVRDCHLDLSSPPVRQGFPTALDGFFRSLAEDQQERAIGIILSGTGSHGTPGMKEIKAVGGMVMVQDPQTAEYDQMPQNAIDTGLVDYSLAPEKMPEILLTLSDCRCVWSSSHQRRGNHQVVKPVLVVAFFVELMSQTDMLTRAIASWSERPKVQE
jgi:two-component system CheB/CheR fusion protein